MITNLKISKEQIENEIRLQATKLAMALSDYAPTDEKERVEEYRENLRRLRKMRDDVA